MLELLQEYEIQYMKDGKWRRFTSCYSEYVDMYIEEAKERGYKEVRAIKRTW